MVIYKITNLINNKIYVGQTCTSLNRRWIQHKSSAKKNKVRSIVQQAIKKYGKDNFTIETLDFGESIEDLNEKEQLWIRKLNSLYPTGYNICSGGKRCKVVVSKPSKQKKAVIRICTLTSEQKVYESITATEKDGFNYKAVCNCCKGWSKTHKNYRWIYKD